MKKQNNKILIIEFLFIFFIGDFGISGIMPDRGVGYQNRRTVLQSPLISLSYTIVHLRWTCPCRSSSLKRDGTVLLKQLYESFTAERTDSTQELTSWFSSQTSIFSFSYPFFNLFCLL